MKNIEIRYVLISALIPFVLLAPFSYVVIKNWDMGIGNPEWILAHAFVPCLFGITGAVIYGVIRFLQKLIYPVGKPWISLIFYIFVLLIFIMHILYKM